MDILKHIEELRDEREWNNYKLSERANVPYPTIVNMFSRRTMPSMATLMALCEAFETVFVLSEDEKNLITQYRKLDKKNKTVVNTLINGLK